MKPLAIGLKISDHQYIIVRSLRSAIMNAPPTPSIPKPPARRRLWWRIALPVLGLAILVVLGLWGIMVVGTQRAWEKAEDEAARGDPRWRLLEIEADRKQIPDPENSALHIMAVARKGGMVGVTGAPNYDQVFDKLAPNVQLNAQQEWLIRGELAKIAKPLVEARQLKDMPYGRFPIKYTDDYFGTLMNEQQSARRLTDWLMHDAYLLAQEGEYDRAVESCQALLNTGRSIGDEPMLISHLIRMSMQLMSVRTLERVLAQGEVSEARLRAIQDLLEKEMREFNFIQGVRGERAGAHHLFENLRSGKVKPTAFSVFVGVRTGGAADSVVGWFLDAFPSTLLKYYPEHLQQLNRAVEAAKLPHHERGTKLQELENDCKLSANPIAKMMAPALLHMHRADCRAQINLRTALVGIACERYRRDTGEWPASLDVLVEKKLLDAIPTDPMDGQPLRYRRTKVGVVIYSVGFDLTDDQGNINWELQNAQGVDLRFRLWNPAQRRQPPGAPIVPPVPEVPR